MSTAVAFSQTLFIARPAAEVWDALTRKEQVDRYYIVPLGSPALEFGGEIFYGPEEEKMITGKVLEVERPKVFAHSFAFGHAPGEPETRVRYEIEDLGAMCALTLTHEGFAEESQTFHDVSGGWPVILSGLKTLLETGEALPWPQEQIPT